MQRIPESELILNEDGSIYHLNLRPEEIANTIITVGDPDRVSNITKHFDTIELSKQKREFKTETGTYKGTRITVISTGIGTDNIDIVLNELDALVNIDFDSRTIKKELTALKIIRIGTSGAIQAHIPVDSFLVSKTAVGFDSLLHFYNSDTIQNHELSEALMQHTNWDPKKASPYVVTCDPKLRSCLESEQVITGFTATNVGFYGPQSRTLRLAIHDTQLQNRLTSFEYNGQVLTNLEMETAGIYGLAKLLGHRAISMNAILANRATQEFSLKPQQVVDDLIHYTLDRIVKI